MTFISYAQNFEDVMLWRALKHVQAGFYIDVGAGHPDDYSVTRAFYDRGWQGINVEPTNRINRLSGARPRDLNLHVAVGCTTGRRTLFVVEDNKDVSTLDPAIAENHHTAGWAIEETQISIVTLADICRRHVRCDINFLKIDVEGAERDVLLGADFSEFRPWIVVIESTAPNSQVPTHDTWEELLTNTGYRFVWFDGLNRFYTANEHWELLSPAFATPPNVFDDFIRSADTEHLNRITSAESRAAKAEAQLVKAQRHAIEADERVKRAESAASNAEARLLRAQEDIAHANDELSQAEARVQAADTRVHQARAIEERAAAAWRRTAVAEAKAAQAEARAAQAEAKSAQAEAKAAQAEAREIDARDWVLAMRASTSWRLTWPLRGFRRLLQSDEPNLQLGNTTHTTSDQPSPVASPELAAPQVVVQETTAIQALTYEANYGRLLQPTIAKATRNGGRILFDLTTSLAWRGAHAVGIIRTERELGSRLLDDPELTVLPVVFHGGALRLLDQDFARSILTVRPAKPHLSEPSSASRPTAIEQGKFEKPLHGRVIAPAASVLRACVRIGLQAIPRSKREDARQALIQIRQAIRDQIYAPNHPVAAPNNSLSTPRNDRIIAQPLEASEVPDLSLVVYPQQDDILFCAGLGWDVIDWGLVELLRRVSNLRIATVLYDLIPVKLPEMIVQSTDYYINYFLHILDECDLALCISECTRNDLLAFAAAVGRPAPMAEVVLLGANVPAEPSASEFSAPGLRERLARRRFALTVGTFEIRKNYRTLIDLWHELVDDETFDLDLVIVGMPGWRVDDILDQLRTSPLLGTRIFWLQGVTDAGLSWLYDNCHLFLYPSLYEGWGLPVVEALQHGRPVIASDRGAIPEAGLGVATIIDPDDRSAWRSAIITESRTPRRRIAAKEIPTWSDTARNVKGHLSRMLCQTEVSA